LISSVEPDSEFDDIDDLFLPFGKNDNELFL